MERLKGKNFILIGIFIVLVITLYLIINSGNKSNKSINASNNKTNNYTLLNNASTFFTVEGCVNKYINVLTTGNASDLMKLLNNKYMEENSIDKNNILNKLDRFEDIYNFNAKKIYQEKINKNVAQYYVYGLLKKDLINGDDLGIDYYVIVKMDQEKLLFDITPYDGQIFKEDIND